MELRCTGIFPNPEMRRGLEGDEKKRVRRVEGDQGGLSSLEAKKRALLEVCTV